MIGISELLSSILGGGVTGLVGVMVQRFADYKNKQLDISADREKFAHEIKMREADAAIMAQEWAAKTRVAEIETDGRTEVADASAFAASFNEPLRYSEGVTPSSGQGWMLVTLDFIRGIVRPGLTLYLCGITTLIYVQARGLLSGTFLAPEQSIALVEKVIGTILYLTTTCLLWWFGVRNKSKV